MTTKVTTTNGTMTPRAALERGAGYLDEATENLTFAEFGWAFEEAWHGVGWVLNALRAAPLVAPGLGERGELPVAGSLARLHAALEARPREAQIALRFEALHARVAADGAAAHREAIERLVFDAWDLHDAAGTRLRLVDERLGDRLVLTEVSPGRVGSRIIERRTALKLLVAGSVLPAVACAKVERDNRPAAAVANAGDGAAPGSAGRGNTESGAKVAQARIKAVTPIRGMNWETSDPFLFCAHHQDDYPQGNEDMGPAASLAGRHLGRDFEGRDNWRMYHGRAIPGFPRHPHRGFETVTVVRSGFLDHADSMGATARYGAGDVQWLTAGRGIQHAEMFPLLRADTANPLELFQIWLNLPRSDKMTDPHFTMLWSERIPRVVETDAAGRIVELTIAAGRYGEHRPPAPPPSSWAARPESDVAIWSIRMEAGARFELPAVAQGTVRSLYVHRGDGVRAGEQAVANMRRVVVEEAGPLVLEAGAAETEVLLLQGRPIGEPLARRGPFVMNTQDEIRQAYADYQRTGFGGWPWRDDGPVHLRQRGRFAIHADGREEEPT